MMKIRGSFKKKNGGFQPQDHGFSQLILSWSLDDILNEQLYKFQKFVYNRRSGTGKTTILTMKLFQNEVSFCIASEGIYAAESSRVRDAEVVDDSEKKNPTVLTDVLLYNFFSTSPLKDQWRVIYGYMKEKNLVDEKGCHSFPSFSEARHNVLCSELKQLYVAITWTR
ncbi:hypothetical protein L6452_13669 [Arctium lappa]|uniref:Uncharacterized protein n=1 Tax=Arctium lappa TaxID=4217 RepID=A0ACB9CIZ0_ARCLA|nr:hypothetical protein L6452_13669 [Arctium lappa]